MTARRCGGCEGQGAHWRWCPELVGPEASRFGILADQAEALGDQVGANNTSAANHLYIAASLLHTQAEERMRRFKGLETAEAPGA